jgi:hypothetical protein
MMMCGFLHVPPGVTPSLITFFHVFSHQSSWQFLSHCWCVSVFYVIMVWHEGVQEVRGFRCLPDEQVCRHNAEAPYDLNIAIFCGRVRSREQNRDTARLRAKIKSQDRETTTDIETARSRVLVIHSMGSNLSSKIENQNQEPRSRHSNRHRDSNIESSYNPLHGK